MAYKTRIVMRNSSGEEYEVKNFVNCRVSRSITDTTSTFSFSIDSFELEDIADKFTIGTEVNIWQGTEDNMLHTISGWINQEPRKLSGLVKSIEFSGLDFGGRLQYRIITEAFEDMDVGEIVASLMRKYASEFQTDIRTTGMKITAKYDKVFLFDVLKELAGIVDYDCYVSIDRIFKFVPAGFAGDGIVQRRIRTNEFKKGSANFSKDASRLVNRLLVAGGQITSKEMRETYKYTESMNNFIQTKRKPVGIDRVPDAVDYRTEYLFRGNFGSEYRGKYKPTDMFISSYYNNIQALKAGLFKYPTNAEGAVEVSALTWEATIAKFETADKLPLTTVKPFFLEKHGSANYTASTGLGVYILNNQFCFFITDGNSEATNRILLTVPESKIWASDMTAVIQCRWYDKTMEIWSNGLLVGSKELDKEITFTTNYSTNTEIHLNTDYSFYVYNTKLSFVKRTEDEMLSYREPKRSFNKVYVYLNNLQLRLATEHLQDSDGYDVMLNYNEQSFDFGAHLGLKTNDVIEILYAYEYTIMDVVENTSSQHKYGLFEDKLVLSSNNREYVRAQANKHIQKYSKPVLVGSIEPFDYTFRVGELITIDIPELKLFETDVKITTIEYSSEPNTLSCKISLESEANVSQIFANIIKRVEFLEAEKFYNEDEEIQQLEKYIEQIQFDDIFEITDIPATTFVFDTAKFNYSEFVGTLEG